VVGSSESIRAALEIFDPAATAEANPTSIHDESERI
jgi:hypothetical protein